MPGVLEDQKMPAPATVPTITTPVPRSDFTNKALRESIDAVLADAPATNGFLLDVSNKGGGVMVVQRLGDSDNWTAMAGVRYTHGLGSIKAGTEVRVAVRGSWK